MESKTPTYNLPVHVINIDIQDNHEEATVGAFAICDLITMVSGLFTFSSSVLRTAIKRRFFRLNQRVKHFVQIAEQFSNKVSRNGCKPLRKRVSYPETPLFSTLPPLKIFDLCPLFNLGITLFFFQ